MNEPMMGAIVGFDTFINDVGKLVKQEYHPNPEEVMNELIEKATTNEGDILGCLFIAEYTNGNHSIDFSFSLSKEDNTMVIFYVGYEEM